jgi:hypothetical protein
VHPIHSTVKITPLLAQYLYNSKQLVLPGIGTFHIDADAVVNTDTTGRNRHVALPPIHFAAGNAHTPFDPELINYIAQHSGKMKPLALADLESHIELMHQFLNIGKPFLLDGIGTLTKPNGGALKFIAANEPVTAPKPIEISIREDRVKTIHEAPVTQESFLHENNRKVGWKKPVIVLLVLAGLGFSIWGGYYLSQLNEADNNTVSETINSVQDTPVTPLSTAPVTPDTANKNSTTPAVSTTNIVVPPADNNGNYKYVLETSNKERAIKRYKQLKTNRWDVHMETADSLAFTLYLSLPKLGADTTRVKDSLSMMTGKRVYIAK